MAGIETPKTKLQTPKKSHGWKRSADILSVAGGLFYSLA